MPIEERKDGNIPESNEQYVLNFLIITAILYPTGRAIIIRAKKKNERERKL